jgi:hypothetical protein
LGSILYSVLICLTTSVSLQWVHTDREIRSERDCCPEDLDEDVEEDGSFNRLMLLPDFQFIPQQM